jgi:hypothetical protein
MSLSLPLFPLRSFQLGQKLSSSLPPSLFMFLFLSLLLSAKFHAAAAGCGGDDSARVHYFSLQKEGKGRDETFSPSLDVSEREKSIDFFFPKNFTLVFLFLNTFVALPSHQAPKEGGKEVG